MFLHDTDMAIAALRAAYPSAASWQGAMGKFRLEPLYDPLRKVPRFQAFLKGGAKDTVTAPVESGHD